MNVQNQIPFDFHSHSRFSPDGESSAEEMVIRAVELGMKCYALTDHVEINKFYDEEFPYEEPVRKASLEIPRLQKKYSNKIKLLYGAEIGQQLHDKPLAERILNTYKYDFIIGSCHMVRGYEDFYYIDYSKVSAEYLLNLYFEELLEMSEEGGFDVLGHLTYPIRYITGGFGIKVDMKKYDAIIDEIFRTLIKNSIGIEINTSGLRQKIAAALPDYPYVKRYRELGGEILSIGSDAHRTEDLGKGVLEGINIAKRAGFDKITYFEKRIPHFIDI